MRKITSLTAILALATCVSTSLIGPAWSQERQDPSRTQSVSTTAPFMIADVAADKKQRRKLRRWRQQLKAKLKTLQDKKKRNALRKQIGKVHQMIVAMNKKIGDAGKGH